MSLLFDFEGLLVTRNPITSLKKWINDFMRDEVLRAQIDVMKQWYEDGQAHACRVVVGSKSHDEEIVWYDNGNMRWRERYDDDALDGVSEFWYTTGRRHAVGCYRGGHIHGELVYYDQEEVEMRREVYCEGVLLSVKSRSHGDYA